MEELDPWLDGSCDEAGAISLEFCEDANDYGTIAISVNAIIHASTRYLERRL
jgi:hypothetical protein